VLLLLLLLPGNKLGAYWTADCEVLQDISCLKLLLLLLL
jgi:hypothetical protein